MNPEIENYLNEYVSEREATRAALLDTIKYALRDDPKFEEVDLLEADTLGITFGSFQFFVSVEDA